MGLSNSSFSVISTPYTAPLPRPQNNRTDQSRNSGEPDFSDPEVQAAFAAAAQPDPSQSDPLDFPLPPIDPNGIFQNIFDGFPKSALALNNGPLITNLNFSTGGATSSGNTFDGQG